MAFSKKSSAKGSGSGGSGGSGGKCGMSTPAPKWLMWVAFGILVALVAILLYQYLLRPALTIAELKRAAVEANKQRKEEFEEKQKRSARLVFLHMDGCGWCAKFQPVWDELQNKHGKDLAKLGVTLEDYESKSPDAVQLAKEAGIKGYPSILLINGQDGSVTKFDGDRTVKGLLAFLDANGYRVDDNVPFKPKEPFYVERVPSGADTVAADSKATIKANKVDDKTQSDIVDSTSKSQKQRSAYD